MNPGDVRMYLNRGDEVANDGRPFLRYTDSAHPIAEARQLAAYVLNHFMREEHSASWYRKRGTIAIGWIDPQSAVRGQPFRFEDLASHFSKRGSWSAVPGDLPFLQCPWLDANPGISSSTSITHVETELNFGSEGIVRPKLDREGVLYVSMQRAMQRNILRLHARIVEQSAKAVALEDDWMSDLRMLIGDSIALIDVTLHHVYFEAARGHRGWRFNPDLLGPRHGRRLNDKLKWVQQITGRHPSYRPEERAAVDTVRVLRNHLTHFDPPCFVYDLDDIEEWLNLMPRIGRFVWRMRDQLGAQLTPELLSIITLPAVLFDPRATSKRKPRDPTAGYASCALGRPADGA